MILALSGFLLVVVSLIVFVFIIGLIIIVHEFGHFLVARKAGILCNEFSIGMGPCIYKHQFKNTLFCLRAIPIGGYVQMADDETSLLLTKGDRLSLTLDEDEVVKIDISKNNSGDISGVLEEFDFTNKNGEGMYLTLTLDDGMSKSFLVRDKAILYLDKNSSIKIASYNETFSSKPIWKRFLTLFAGPCMNFLLAIIIYFIYYCAIGVPNYDTNQIGEVGYGYAGSSYLETGDKIIAVNGKNVNSWYEFEDIIDEYNKNYPTEVELKVINSAGEEETCLIPYSIIINSIGISNLQISDNNYPEGVTSGAILGNVGLNYSNKSADPKYPLSSGDIITAIRVDNYINSDTTSMGEVVEITSWQDLINNLKDVDVAEIRFEYYDLEKAKENPQDPYVKIEECEPLVSWGNETLTNQGIEKIELLIGISPVYHFELGGVITSAFKGFWNDFTLVFRTLKLLIAPSGIRQVGVSNLTSVVGIFGMVKNLVQTGILPILAFTAMLSVNIGIVNLLPIPALDGGRIIFLIYEFITRKKPNKKFEAALNGICFILLMLLFIYVTYNDILRFNFISFVWRI